MSAFRYVPIEALSLAFLVGVAAAAAASAPALVRRDSRAALRTAARVLLLGAVLSAVAVTVLNGAGAGLNLVPGAGIADSLDNVNSDLGRLNVFGNVVMFIPIGFLLPLATRFGRRGATTSCAALSLAIELTQLVVGRNADIDDVLLNTVGGALGAAMGVATQAWFRSRVEQQSKATS